MEIYEAILRDYVGDLREAKQGAELWWGRLIAEETSRSGNHDEAVDAVGTRWPVGPVSHPSIIAVYRTYYLLINTMNERLVKGDGGLAADDSWGVEEDSLHPNTIEPHLLLLDDLSVIDEELGAFMENFVAPCIGIDAAGNVT